MNIISFIGIVVHLPHNMTIFHCYTTVYSTCLVAMSDDICNSVSEAPVQVTSDAVPVGLELIDTGEIHIN